MDLPSWCSKICQAQKALIALVCFLSDTKRYSDHTGRRSEKEYVQIKRRLLRYIARRISQNISDWSVHQPLTTWYQIVIQIWLGPYIAVNILAPSVINPAPSIRISLLGVIGSVILQGGLHYQSYRWLGYNWRELKFLSYMSTYLDFLFRNSFLEMYISPLFKFIR